jgi:hypothetical protein
MLPVEWWRKVETEVSKRNRDGQMVVDGLPVHLDATMVDQFIAAETGVLPRRVKPLAPGKWKIQGADEDHRLEMMKLDRQRLDDGTRITVKLVEDRLSVKDIDLQMRRWLQVDDRVSNVLKADRTDDRVRRDDRHRYTREVSIEDLEAEAETIAAVTDSSRQKPKPRSAELHPKKGKGTDKSTEGQESEKKTEEPVASNAAPAPTSPTPPVPGPRGPAPQWSPDAQWWYGEQWSGPAYWTPQWTSWGDGRGGSYAGGYNGDNGGWSGRGGVKGDKGGKGGKTGKGGKAGDANPLPGGRGKAWERY